MGKVSGMKAKNFIALFSLFVVLAVTARCDPGYFYRGVDQTCASSGESVECSALGIVFTIEELEGFDSGNRFVQEFVLANNTDESLKVLGIQLITENGVSLSYDLGSLAEETKNINPYSEEEFFIVWKIDAYPTKFLGSEFTVSVRLGRDPEELNIDIRYQRAK